MSVDVVVSTMSYLICEHNYCTMFTSTIITYYIITCSQHHQYKVDGTTEMVSVHSTSRCLVSRGTNTSRFTQHTQVFVHSTLDSTETVFNMMTTEVSALPTTAPVAVPAPGMGA